jgi:predicted permease
MARDPAWRRYLRFTRPDPGADVDDELRFHLEELERGFLSQGYTTAEAQRAAREQFGDVKRTRAELASRTRHRQRRDARTEWWQRLRQDTRVALRRLARQPGFAITAIATLALGIGANVAVFSVVNAALLQPLPYPDADRIVSLYEEFEGRPFTVSPPNFTDWRAQATGFEEMAAYLAYPRTLTGAGDPQPLQSALVTGDFFDVMGIHPVLGRGFTADELVYGQTDVAILSDAVWRTNFGEREDILGQSIELEGRSRVVVGVMPPGFDYPAGSRVWTPWAFSERDLTTQRGAHYLTVVARVRDGMEPATAIAEISAIADRLAREYPATNDKYGAGGTSLRESIVGESSRTALIVLMAAVALVTLIACANVANLMLARGEGRLREMAVRSSLGARTGDLIVAALTESVLLSMLGGAAAIAVAYWGTSVLDAVRPASLQALGEARLDPPVLAFTAGLSLLTGLLFGLTPAMQAARAGRAHGTLRAEGRGNTMGRSGWRLRGAIVASELALAVMLLAGAGLLIRSFSRLTSVEPGFTTSGLLTFQLSLPSVRYPREADTQQFYDRLFERVQAIPGVTAVEAMTGLPLDEYGYSMSTSFLDGVHLDPATQPSTQVRIVTPGLFSAMGMRLLRGRGFESSDRAGAPGAVVLNESAARLLFDGQDAIGHSMALSTSFGFGRGRAGGEIVGIVEDFRDQALGVPPRPMTFLAHAQWPVTDMAVVVRSGNPLGVVPAIRAELRRMDPLLPMVAVRTMERIASASVTEPRFAMLLLGTFAGVALVLAAIGVFGVMHHVVGERTREIGLRMALGAGGPRVVFETVRRALGPVAVGVVVGVAGALALSSSLEAMLYEVTPGDPTTYIAVAGVLALVAVIAAWIPARRASTVDPVVALRAE